MVESCKSDSNKRNCCVLSAYYEPGIILGAPRTMFLLPTTILQDGYNDHHVTKVETLKASTRPIATV